MIRVRDELNACIFMRNHIRNHVDIQVGAMSDVYVDDDDIVCEMVGRFVIWNVFDNSIDVFGSQTPQYQYYESRVRDCNMNNDFVYCLRELRFFVRALEQPVDGDMITKSLQSQGYAVNHKFVKMYVSGGLQFLVKSEYGEKDAKVGESVSLEEVICSLVHYPPNQLP